MPTPGMSEQAQ